MFGCVTVQLLNTAPFGVASASAPPPGFSRGVGLEQRDDTRETAALKVLKAEDARRVGLLDLDAVPGWPTSVSPVPSVSPPPYGVVALPKRKITSPGWAAPTAVASELNGAAELPSPPESELSTYHTRAPLPK